MDALNGRTVSRRSTTDLRHDGGRTVSGTVLKYGDTANIYGMQESIARGAFGDVSKGDIILNFQHSRGKPLARTGGGGLELEETGDGITMRAELPNTTHGNDALELVKKGVLRGLSVEMRIHKTTNERERYTINSATLSGIGLVDKPAYPQSTISRAHGMGFRHLPPVAASVRQTARGAIKGFVEYSALITLSLRNDEKIMLMPGAFVNLKDNPEVYLLAGKNYDTPLATTMERRGLTIEETDKGIAFAAASLPRTNAARDTRQLLRRGLVNAVTPGFVTLASEVVDGVEIVSQANLCELYLSTRSNGGSTIRRAACL